MYTYKCMCGCYTKNYNTILNTDMPEDPSTSEEQKSQAKELLVSAHLNLSLVYLKVTPAHHYEAKDHATKALKFDENNVKGLFRRGQALLGLGEADAALVDFQKVVEKEPQNKACYVICYMLFIMYSVIFFI